MQHKQQNYKIWLCALALAIAGIGASSPAHSAGKPDPILTGGPTGPCDPQSASADYAGGTDINGNPVAPADLQGPRVPVPSQLAIPLKSGRPGAPPIYVSADGKTLDPLLNPTPSCPAVNQPR